MAFSPSIGDILALIQIVTDVYQRTMDAPSEITAAIKDLKGMKAELESMKDKVGDEKYFVKKNGGAMSVSDIPKTAYCADLSQACNGHRHI
jgi:hypothetical protein